MDGWRVPSKDYRRQYEALLPELGPLLERTLLEEEPVLGAPLADFERAFAAYLGTRHVVGVGSGTDALVLALRLVRLRPGDQVITAANTFFASVTAILMAGGAPVLVDPDPETMVLTADSVRAAIGPRTRAVLPVHLYGRAAPAGIAELCRERGLALVEDVAQAHGARADDGRRAGALGGFGCFSFHPSKNLGAFGDGGAIALDDDAGAEELRALRHLGKTGEHEVRHVSGNCKLDTLQAVILRLKLARLDAGNARRRALAGLYRERLAGVGDLTLPDDPGGEGHVYHLFVVRTRAREVLREFLGERGIKASVHYPIPPHLQPLPVDLGHREGDFRVAEECARTVLSLPISPELDEREIELVCDGVRAFFARGGRA
jgi:dTDP-4-amino-4,6-dideoxygalactose transaminase